MGAHYTESKLWEMLPDYIVYHTEPKYHPNILPTYRVDPPGWWGNQPYVWHSGDAFSRDNKGV